MCLDDRKLLQKIITENYSANINKISQYSTLITKESPALFCQNLPLKEISSIRQDKPLYRLL